MSPFLSSNVMNGSHLLLYWNFFPSLQILVNAGWFLILDHSHLLNIPSGMVTYLFWHSTQSHMIKMPNTSLIGWIFFMCSQDCTFLAEYKTTCNLIHLRYLIDIFFPQQWNINHIRKIFIMSSAFSETLEHTLVAQKYILLKQINKYWYDSEDP